MTAAQKKSVLVVDDIESIRFAIRDYLSRWYQVDEAEDGYAALQILNTKKIDFVITDIRMPGMGGLELVEHLRSGFPDVRYALMTAYNVDDYVQYARVHHIWNIIPKTTFLDLRFIHTMVDKLLTGDIFGVKRYFPDAREEKMTFPGLYRIVRQEENRLPADVFYRCGVETPEEHNHIPHMVADALMRSGAPRFVHQVLEELTSNAAVWGPAASREDAPDHRPAHNEFTNRSPYEIVFGLADSCALVSVVDFHGSLKREDVLYRLERHVTVDESGLPIGIADAHGRGLFISREHMDHLIFNIDPGVRSEVIGILSLETAPRTRALSIYQTKEV